MIYSGMMPGELFILQKDMIHWDKQQIIGCGLKTKKRKETPMVIANYIIPVLQDLCSLSDKDNLLDMNEHKFYDTFRATIKRLNLRCELVAYSCRHSTGTALALQNIAPSVIQKALRHTKFSTTEKYIHPDTEDVLGAMNRLNPDEQCQL